MKGYIERRPMSKKFYIPGGRCCYQGKKERNFVCPMQAGSEVPQKMEATIRKGIVKCVGCYECSTHVPYSERDE